MLTDNFYRKVLIEPAEEGADELVIVSGYITASMAYKHLKGPPQEKSSEPTLPKEVRLTLLYGMYPQDGILRADHISFQRLCAEFDNLIVKYYHSKPAIHSKVYLWRKKGEPVRSFLGSANYSQSAFSGKTVEILNEFEPSDAEKHVLPFLRDGVDCRTIADSELIVRKPRSRGEKGTKVKAEATETLEFVDLPLTKGGHGLEVHMGAGLNWSFRKNFTRANREEAYLPVPTKVCNSQFFPSRERYFLVGTDDGEVMIMVTAQGKSAGASIDRYGAIETPEDNSILGAYFRKRIGKAIGTDLRHKPITLDHLKAYGRLDVRLYRLDDETYTLEFARKQTSIR